jgi:ribosomal-protein-alanine N-acetyltransferase
MLSKTIETDRLILRRYKETDIDMQYKILNDSRLTTYIKFPNLTKEEELDCIKNWIKDADVDKYEKWVIVLKENNLPIGNISVNDINKKNNYCNVGYVIAYDYWGNGYASEALKAVSDHLLDDEEYYLVECSCNELNVQSSKVMLKAGFKKDGYIANRRLNKDGTYSGVEYYSKSKQ